MLDRKPRINVIPNVKDEIFLTNQIDVRFFPDIFKIEFKQVNQQVDRINDDANNTIIINRRSIALTPMMMKQLIGILSNVVSNYEKQYGSIKIPEMPKIKKEVNIIEKPENKSYIG